MKVFYDNEFLSSSIKSATNMFGADKATIFLFKKRTTKFFEVLISVNERK